MRVEKPSVSQRGIKKRAGVHHSENPKMMNFCSENAGMTHHQLLRVWREKSQNIFVIVKIKGSYASYHCRNQVDTSETCLASPP